MNINKDLPKEIYLPEANRLSEGCPKVIYLPEWFFRKSIPVSSMNFITKKIDNKKHTELIIIHIKKETEKALLVTQFLLRKVNDEQLEHYKKLNSLDDAYIDVVNEEIWIPKSIIKED